MRIYELASGRYIPKTDRNLIRLDLGVTLWEGFFEGKHSCWLRWYDNEGRLLQTGYELSESERQRAESEHLRAKTAEYRADSEYQRAEVERQRAETAEDHAKADRQRVVMLSEKLRSLGIDPDKSCDGN